MAPSRGGFLLLLVATALAPALAWAQLRIVGLPASVRVGDIIELRWEGLPAEAEECEFLLRLDGGRWVRISPEMDVYERRWLWRVPDVVTSRAQLRVRWGGETCGRRDERESEPTVPFVIASSRSASPRPSGEHWWNAFATPLPGTATSLAGGATAELRAAHATAFAESPPRTALGANRGRGATFDAPAETHGDPSPGRRGAFRSFTSMPLRI